MVFIKRFLFFRIFPVDNFDVIRIFNDTRKRVFSDIKSGKSVDRIDVERSFAVRFVTAGKRILIYSAVNVRVIVSRKNSRLDTVRLTEIRGNLVIDACGQAGRNR